MEFNNWPDEDLEDLDRKFDALCEHLNIEFVFERVSDGSEWADRQRVYVRERKKDAPEAPKPEPEPEPVREATPEPMPYFEKKKHKKGYDY